jgi:hypothetical protein
MGAVRVLLSALIVTCFLGCGSVVVANEIPSCSTTESQRCPRRVEGANDENGAPAAVGIGVASLIHGLGHGAENEIEDSLSQWDESFDPSIDSDHCDIEKIPAALLSRERFQEEFLEKKPVIIVGATNTTEFTRRSQKGQILKNFGNHIIVLSSANSNSYEKKEAFFKDYVNSMMKPQSLNVSGAETFYHFGDNKHAEWDPLFKFYQKPEKYIFGKYASLSFGLGGSGSGVPFHGHGHVFAEVFYGKKRWLLTKPGEDPKYNGDESSLHWHLTTYPNLSHEEKAKLYECVCQPGEMLYIPTFWPHSTLNIGQTVFMSVFV